MSQIVIDERAVKNALWRALRAQSSLLMAVDVSPHTSIISAIPAVSNDTAKLPALESTVRHTRGIARGRSKRSIRAPPAEAVAACLQEIVHPAMLQQVCYFHDLGLCERALTLPMMVGWC